MKYNSSLDWNDDSVANSYSMFCHWYTISWNMTKNEPFPSISHRIVYYYVCCTSCTRYYVPYIPVQCYKRWSFLQSATIVSLFLRPANVLRFISEYVYSECVCVCVWAQYQYKVMDILSMCMCSILQLRFNFVVVSVLFFFISFITVCLPLCG